MESYYMYISVNCLFHSIFCFLYSSMFMCIAIVYSFSLLYSTLLQGYITIYLSILLVLAICLFSFCLLKIRLPCTLLEHMHKVFCFLVKQADLRSACEILLSNAKLVQNFVINTVQGLLLL